ncbi:MAG: extracellular solute-binding protein [Bacillus subtilis]|nr:extracellular solute-binding protein [Bacillus subtilis]
MLRSSTSSKPSSMFACSYKSAGSNEEMATLLMANTTAYDIVIPSEYMIDKLIQADLLQPIDVAQLSNYAILDVIDELEDLYTDSAIAPYVVPYAWGTIGILYNTTNAALKPLIEAEEWAALFEYGKHVSRRYVRFSRATPSPALCSIPVST